MKIKPNKRTIMIKPYVAEKKDDSEKKTTGFTDFAFSSENKAKKWDQYKPYVIVDMSEDYLNETKLRVGDFILAEAASVSVVTMPKGEIIYFISSGDGYIPLSFEE